MRVRLHIIVLCLLMLCSASLLAQKKVFVRGYVLDESRQAIEFANVLQLGTSNGSTTNAQGFYELQCDHNNDSITLRFSYIGYKSVTKTFVPEGKSVNLTITLLDDATELGTVEVRGIQRNEDNMVKIDTKNINLTPEAGGGGIEGLIKMEAGVNSSNELSSQYSVRGGSYDENCIYVNGVEVFRPLLLRSGQQEGLSFINPDLVQSVEFSAGGFSARYGDKMSSVLDVTYKKPERFEASVSASLLGTTAYVGSSSKRFTQVHGLRYRTSQYLLGTLDTKGSYDTWFLDYQTYMTLQLSKHWNISVLGNIAQNTYRFRPQTADVSFGTQSIARNLKIFYEGQERDRFRTLFGVLALNYEPTTNAHFSWNVSAFNSNERETYDILGEYLLSELSYDSNGNSTNGDALGTGTFHQHARNRLNATIVSTALNGKFNIGVTEARIGMSYQREFVQDNIQEWERRDSADYSLPYDPNVVRLVYNLNAHTDLSTTRFQGYVEDTYKYDGEKFRWVFNLGVRANYWSYNQEWLISPRASIIFIPRWKHDMSFRLAGGLYHQAPFYKELRKKTTDELGNSTVELNSHIRAQRSLHLLLGYDYYFRLWNRPFKFTAEAYYKPCDRVITYSMDNLQVRYSGENDARAYTTGLDFKLFGEFVPGVDSWLSFSLMRSREDILNDSYKVYSNTGSYLGEVFPGELHRPNEQAYSISLFFQDYLPNHPEYRFYLKLIWADGVYFGSPRSERYECNIWKTGSYRRVDIGASRGFMRGRERFMSNQNVVDSWWINLEFFNLFNIKNEGSQYFITDIYGNEYSAPNYLTSFTVNLKLVVNFGSDKVKK